MLLEDFRVDNAVPHEHGTDKLARARPEFSIRGKDTVAQELLPLAVEGLTLAIIGELARQESLDVLRVLGHNSTCRDTGVQLSGFDICLASRRGNGFTPEFDILVGQVRFLARIDEVECCVLLSALFCLKAMIAAYRREDGSESLEPWRPDERSGLKPGVCGKCRTR